MESILSNSSEDFEVILNDDCSDDDTLAIARTYSCDPRLTCNLADRKLGTVENWKACCRMARGNYIYIVGSDDYISTGGIDRVIPELTGDCIVTAPMRCFLDVTNATRDVQATPEMVSKIFLDLGRADGNNLLLYSNHDELVHNFFPRKAMSRVFGLAPDSGNTVFFLLGSASISSF